MAVGVGGVGAAVQEVPPGRDPALEVGVLGVDAAVDHVDGDARGVGGVAVGVVEPGVLVDPVEPPAGRIGLHPAGRDGRGRSGEYERHRRCGRKDPHDRRGTPGVTG